MKTLRRGVLVIAALTVLGALAWWGYRFAFSPPDDPRLSYPTPYRNVRPDVKYVGDDACAACHADISDHYSRHPMSHSLAPMATAPVRERFDADARNPFTLAGFAFHVVQQGNRSVHRVRRLTDGDAGPRLEEPVHYAVGSGTRGRTYLVERNGHLVQSPISWFANKGVWDLTPGFHVEERFERPAQVACLFCHCNSVQPVAHTLNRYEPPLFRGHGIGCERCHGPGELHVSAHQDGSGDRERTTIVNPAHLTPRLRDAVCEQCHLQGEVRIVRHGRQLFDYRPGLPLELFVSAFVRKPEFADGPTAGGHAEQMQASRCFQASEGKLGCISCHDPHAVIPAAEKGAHYRKRCLQCHAETSCSLAPAERRKTNPADSCIDCHLPLSESRIAHTAIADHQIRRRPAPARAPVKPRILQPGEVPLRAFHGEVEGRDLGLALGELAKNYPALSGSLGPTALPLLEAAVKRSPDDVAAREALGFVLWQLNRPKEGMAVLQAVLKEAPDRELALTYAAVLAGVLRRPEEAAGYWRRAIAVNPHSATYHVRLAKVHADSKEWEPALAACTEALRLDPLHQEARTLRATCAAKPR